MRPRLGDPALLEDDDEVGVLDRREAVRDEEDGARPRPGLHGLEDPRLGLGVDGGEGVVEDEERGVREESARERGPLLLPPERVMPRSPTIVSSPFGKRREVGAEARLRARPARPPSRVAPGRPNAMFAARVSEKRNVSCGTATSMRRRSGRGISRRSRPPSRTEPNGGS